MEENGKIRCLNCPDNLQRNSAWERDENGHIIIDEDGVDIDLKDNGDSFKMKIDENGLRIKANDDN